MKKLKLILPLAVLFSVFFCGKAKAQYTSNYYGVYYYISNNVPGDYTVTFYGEQGQGTYTYNVSVDPGTEGFFDNLPGGNYEVVVECLDTHPGLGMIFYSGDPYGEGLGDMGSFQDDCQIQVTIGSNPDSAPDANELDIDVED